MRTLTIPRGLSRVSTGWRAFACAFIAYALVTIVLFWPLPRHLSSVLPHDLGDPLLSLTVLWWNAHVVPLTRSWWDGFGFFPAPGMMAFSDHRLGVSVVASPLIWIGASPAAAYNVTLLLMFPLSALAAHALGFVLTRRHDAAALCALAYGFNPYRIAHLEHLELLASFGMPAALAALHLYVQTRRPRWLGLFTLALAGQALCTSYYFLFFGVFLALWLLWFVPPRQWRVTVAIAAASAVSVVVLLPIAIGYWRIHHAYGFARTYPEIIELSADVTSFVTASPLSALWGWTARWNPAERQLFPGLTIVVLTLPIAAAAIAALRTARDRLDTVATALAVVSLAFTAISLATSLFGSWRLHAGFISASASVAFKPLSLAALALTGSIAAWSRTREAVRRRSVLAFYLLAAAVMLVCSLGPKPAFLHAQILYEPPYAWLMRLPLGDSVRVPARFAMPAILALSVAASLAFTRLRWTGSGRRLAAGLLMAGIVADGAVRGLPLLPLPEAWPIARAESFAAVVELPLGDTDHDVAAMYRATLHRRPTVNGYSGYDPSYYVALRLAIANRDTTALPALNIAGPLLIVVDTSAGDNWSAFAAGHRGASPLGVDGRWAFFRLDPRRMESSTGCAGGVIPVVAASADDRPLDPAIVSDNDEFTWWSTRQDRGRTITLDLGRTGVTCSLVLSSGTLVGNYPRALSVSTSIDGANWQEAFSGRMGGMAVRSALERPRDPRLEIALRNASARFVRMQLAESDPRNPWIVTEVTVTGAR
jgi:hypothetical protein